MFINMILINPKVTYDNLVLIDALSIHTLTHFLRPGIAHKTGLSYNPFTWLPL